MTLNQNSPQINPDQVDDYIYDYAQVDAADLIDIRALLALLRQDYGDVDYFTPDNNPDSDFCVAVFQRATRHNDARLAELVDAADSPQPQNDEPELAELPTAPRNWLLPVSCLVALLIPFFVMAGSVVAVAAIAG